MALAQHWLETGETAGYKPGELMMAANLVTQTLLILCVPEAGA